MKIDWQKHPQITRFEYISWLVGLIGFSIFYNKYVDWLVYTKGEERSKTARLVMLGVAVTMLPASRFLTPWEFTRCAFLFFASGPWMIYGHWRRDQWDRELNQITKTELEQERRARQV